ncbi:hypothetical protein Sjap_021721 [Stephania japonica]|uniref:PHD-type domain-containing protein n=1 Tax=Stephania japonica TaxID=461633 RepID=A0AAP0HRY2_9MAGN
MVAEECSGSEFRTYSRKKLRFSSQDQSPNDERSSVNALDQVASKRIKQSQSVDLCSSSEQNGLHKMNGPLYPQRLAECGNQLWRNTVLENISLSLDVSEGGIQSCIQEALASNLFGSTEISKFHGASAVTAAAPELKEPKISSGSQNASMEHAGATSDGPQSKPNEENDMTSPCQHVFHDLIVSEKFSLLCKLMGKNFQGIKVDSFTDFNVIDSRMREGAYGKSPMLFYVDVQAVWRKFQKIANEMASLAKGLSDLSRTYYNEQVGPFGNGICVEEFELSKPEQANISGLDKVSICRSCGKKAVGKDCLICDSCEEIYHFSCIEPAVQKIPPRCWYCTNCTASGIEPSHANCVVCERINGPATQVQSRVSKGLMEPIATAALRNLGDKSTSMGNGDVIRSSSESRVRSICKICRQEDVEGHRLPSRICGHSQCSNKYYHERCLSLRQLKTYGRCWYCPSCLCVACLTDKDDDKIVLCDGCDHAYHIYCMKPPRASIPKGKWFCEICIAGIQAIHEAKRFVVNFEKRPKNGKYMGLKSAVGSVDMLLSAAETLKSEEKLKR